MTRFIAIAAIAGFSTTANAALCMFEGSVPTYVMCIAEQAASNEDRLDAMDLTVEDLQAEVAANVTEIASLQAQVNEAPPEPEPIAAPSHLGGTVVH